MQNNIEAVISVMRFIYDNIMYAELNTKSDFCHNCNNSLEVKIVEDESGKLIWECPNCGCRKQDLLSIARRTCGYIGTQKFNQGNVLKH
jgi:ribonucleoside-triphosphate reductase